MKNYNSRILGGARLRIILALFIVVVAGAVGVFLWKHHQTVSAAEQSTVSLSNAPKLNSHPGVGKASNQYVADQNLENAQKAEKARKDATSSVPTITRPNFVGNPDDFGTLKAAGHVCPMNKETVMFKPNPANCSLDNLQRARTAGVSAEELRCQACSCEALKGAGYSAGDLKSTGYEANQLKKCGFNLQQLVEAGYSADDLKAAGFSAKQLKDAGFTAGQLKAAGFSAEQLKNSGFSADAIKNAGYSAAGPVDTKACSTEALKKAHEKGVSASELKDKACSLAALKAAGYTAEQLKAAGYTPGQLKAAGFTADDLKKAGFAANDLKKAGFSAKQLHDAGFSAHALKRAGYAAGQLKDAGYSAKDLKHAGYTPKQLRAAGVSASDLKDAGVSSADLAKAGFTKGELLRAGFTPKEAGYETRVVEPSHATAEKNTLDSSASIPSVSDNSPDEQLARLARAQRQQMDEQRRNDAIQTTQGAMTMQAQSMLAEWSHHSNQAAKEALAPVVNTADQNDKQSVKDVNEGPTLKAGSVMFATLDTSINSDEDTPIMASIVSGPLKGSKLLGKFVRVDKKVKLQFNLLNIPTQPKSTPMSAVAIDPDTARTAVSGEVDNHYLLRYGSLFASAFLAGVSDAVLQGNSQTQCIGFTCITSHNSFNTGQAALAGAGKVGQQYSNIMKGNFTMPPTIKIAGGTGVGILLMQDLTLPQLNPSITNK